MAVIALVLGLSGPALGDVGSDSRFVAHLYFDLLHRPAHPTRDDLVEKVARLQGGAFRSAVAAELAYSTEFAVEWVEASFLRYLERLPTPSEATVGVAMVTTPSHDFLALERALTTGAEYRSLHGDGWTGVVSAWYQQILYRGGSPTEVGYWVSRLAGGEAPGALASLFMRSYEASRKRVAGVAGPGVPCVSTSLSDAADLSSGSYCLLLHRAADQAGADYWVSQLVNTGQLPSMWIQITASPEYYGNAQVG